MPAQAETQLFINSLLQITQNTNTLAQYLPEGSSYDYILKVNVASLCEGNMSLLFSNASFSQNLADLNNVNINITLQDHVNFTNWSSKFNNVPLTTLEMAQSTVAFNTLQPSVLENIGDRFLEIVAHKLFGHGQARAAINNDSEFFTHDNQVWDHLVNSVAQTSLRHDIFNQYVGSGRYGAEANSNAQTDINTQNDVNNGNGGEKWVNFNFNGLTFDFPMYLNGKIILDSSLTNAEINLLQNGPSVGGTSLSLGNYNVPVLVKFHQ